ncbi:hypothetical protein Pla175_03100 [Pirellulimonas nuda]|uniref:Glycosyl transferases group 1 n=1 Tax=Pirellulimonas nuda TaxID=2528009 RepID=A0A518D658_9BACT|nr:hypothetical protein [Pirellulimonas nuda]QDU86956.1 hypothetical protein Pla175_03100 [Pirellulimonas nuda]
MNQPRLNPRTRRSLAWFRASHYARLKFLTDPLNDWLRRGRSYVMPSHYRYVRRLVRGASPAPLPGEKTALVDLHTRDFDADGGRYFYLLLRNLRRCGYRVVIVNNYRFLAESKRKVFKRRYFEEFPYELCDAGSGVQSAGVGDGAGGVVVWTDRRDPRRYEGVDAKIVRVLPIAGCRPANLAPASVWMPYPALQEPATHEELAALRQTPRTARVLFAGRTAPEYHSRKITRLHGVVSRLEMIELLLDSELPLQHYARLADVAAPAEPQAVWLPPYDRGAFRTTGVIDAAQWLGLLGRADFYIASPGTGMPLAHNVVEAMQVGTVPIIEYGDYFRPPLTDGVNALVFRGARGFLGAVERAIAMDAARRAAMHAAVVEYYDTHLRFDSFLRKVEASQERVVEVQYYG